MLQQFHMAPQSKTQEKFTIVRGNVRISVLTDRLIRVEHSRDGKFLDAPTQAVWFRDFAQPNFSIAESSGLTIQTQCATFVLRGNPLKLKCVKLQDGSTVKNFNKGNLKGTYRTLDMRNGAAPLGKGLLSKNGVSVYDDSKTLLINPDGSFQQRDRVKKDQYFFAYGHDYRTCLQDFFQLTGKVPLVPRYCLGNWWSRYKAYTQDEYIHLIQRFMREDVPLTVATIDMDWHWVDIKKQFGDAAKPPPGASLQTRFLASGWTGYSWNTDLFPDYKGFLRWLKEQNLKVTMNLHPADGIRCFEDMYPEVAEACGIDPKTKAPVPFRITDERFVSAYFEKVHHPYEEDGVDFWWIDWQQGKNSGLKGLDPLWALNHYHYLDNARNNRRGLILSRFAEVGSHRYPLGFSGDAAITWKSLDFQPYYTANASNVGYTWWSHDIGGHNFGVKDDELALRWVQFGVFSPVMRLHSTHNAFTGKEPWNFRFDVELLIKRNLRLRHRMLPYLYTANEQTHRQGLALCEPMYYQHPENEEAYHVPNQYYFGSELIVAPITEHTHKKTNLGSVSVWLPQGRFTDIFNGYIYEGGGWVTMHRGVESIPALAKAGAIIPLDGRTTGNRSDNPDLFEVWIYRGNNSFTLYEDDGETMAYQGGACAQTPLRVQESGDVLTFTIDRVQGDASVIPASREYTLAFRDVAACQSIIVQKNGEAMPFTQHAEDVLTLGLQHVTPQDTITVSLQGFTARTNRPKAELLTEVISKFQGGTDHKNLRFRKFIQNPSKKTLTCRKPHFRNPILEVLELA